MADESNIELEDIGYVRNFATVASSSSGSSDFYQYLYDTNRHIFISTQDTNSYQTHLKPDLKYYEPLILVILRLLSYHKIRVFPADSTINQIVREPLGDGSTFVVDASDLPIWRAMSNFRYRDLNFPRRREKFYFTDHTDTKWDYNTIAAYKTLVYGEDRERDKLMLGLVTELRILSHPPLQRHPNIVHIIGFAWVRDEQFFANVGDIYVEAESSDLEELREWPAVVTEKAPHGSLKKFMSSLLYRNTRCTLDAKILLCMDVLNGISALHSCNILHGDVKCDNVLVYTKSGAGTAENWTARLSDFSHSIVSDHFRPGNITTPGTISYSPPESGKPSENFDTLKLSDIWCFGLLVWEVMLDGTLEKSALKEFLTKPQVTNQGRIGTPVELCEHYLGKQHPRESSLIEIVSSLLRQCLNEDPSSRPSANRLLEYMQRALSLQERYITLQPVLRPRNLTSLDDLPVFDLSDCYYDLRETLTIPQQVFRGLQTVESWSLSDARSCGKLQTRLSAELQLGLCYAAGFGAKHNSQKAIEYIRNAAREGYIEAGVILPRVYAAFGVAIEDDQEAELLSWLDEASTMGSITAIKDLEDLRRDYKFKASHCLLPWVLQSENKPTTPIYKVPPLHQAVLAGGLDDVISLIKSPRAEVNVRGKSGETALHFTIFLPEALGKTIAVCLLEVNADIFISTSALFTFTRHKFILNDIEEKTTPLHLAIRHDHFSLVKLFTDSVKNWDDERYWRSSDNIIALAARYQSLRCLEYFLEAIPRQKCTEYINSFNDRMLSPMYYACRPDFFGRLYLYGPGRTPSHPSRTGNPLVARELHVIDLLGSRGSKFQAHEENIFTLVHLVASFGDHVILDKLLSTPHCAKMKDEMSDYNWTPLKDTIARGRFKTFEVLLKHNARMRDVWVSNSQNRHAIHICSLYPGCSAIKFAEAILKKDPKCLHLRGKNGATSLHYAAVAGHAKMIRFYGRKKDMLLATDNKSVTPLGAAVLYRISVAIRELSELHKQQKLPLVSLIRYPHIMCIMGIGRYIHPIEQLLTPGQHHSTSQMKFWSFYSFGCCDYPFSDESYRILKTLLSSYPSQTKVGTNLFQNTLYHPLVLSGVKSAIEMGNLEAIKLIVGSLQNEKKIGITSALMRKLLLHALSQLSVARNHIASEEERKSVVDYIWGRCDDSFQSSRKHRLAEWLLLGLYWRVYYSAYGDIEHKLLDNAKDWLQHNRFHEALPSTPEYYMWHDARISPMLASLCLLILILIPTMVCLGILAVDPVSHWDMENLIWTLVAVLLTVFLNAWTKLFRITFVYFNLLQKEYDPRSMIRLILQLTFYILVVALSILSCWIWYPGSYHLLQFDIRYFVDDHPWNGSDLPHWKQLAITGYHYLCNILIAWNVLTIIIPSLCIAFLRARQTVRARRAKRLDMDQDSEYKTIVKRCYPDAELMKMAEMLCSLTNIARA